jgi:hypothetical protein
MTLARHRVTVEAVLLRFDDTVLLPNGGVLVGGSFGLARFFSAVSRAALFAQQSQS